MNCVRCGTELPAGSKFCANCGLEVTDPGLATVHIATAEEQDAVLVQLRKDLGNDYEIERELGRGGMAVVYKAFERELQRPVALKVLPPGTGGQMAERFRREARMAAQLGHPNIIPVYRVGQAAGTYFFAMKFVEGRALDAIIEQQGALPIPVILAVLRGAVAGLAFAHERNIVHRDIKGANVLIERDGHVLLSDLGIARAAEDKTLTATGSVIGTPHFMSPEQCSGHKVGPQGDQYSMGVLAFQMLTGSVPFDSDTLMGILQHHFFTPVPDVAAVRADVPPKLIEVVRRAMEKEAAQRFPTTREMLKAIEAVPFTDEDRGQAEELLRQLAQGSPVPKIRTGSLPPLADTRVAGLRTAVAAAPTVTAARPSGPGRKAGAAPKKRLLPVAAGVVVVVAAAGIGAAVMMKGGRAPTQAPDSIPTPPAATLPSVREQVAAPADSAKLTAAESVTTGTPAAAGRAAGPEPRRRDTPGRPADASRRPRRETTPTAAQGQQATPEPAATGTGFLRVSTSPPSAEIFVGNRRVGVGGVVDEEIPAGRAVRIRVTAAGYVAEERTCNVQPGERCNLGRITLQAQP
jgi:serine/threonine-protein kinase